MKKEEMIKMRDSFREIAGILDDLIVFEEKINNDEDINKEEYDAKIGLFMYKMFELDKNLK